MSHCMSHCTCSYITKKPHKVSPPRPDVLHQEIGIDVFDVLDATGKRSSIFDVVLMGITYDQAWMARESESLGSPSSYECLNTSVDGWTRWAGWTKPIRCDGGEEYLATLLSRKVWQSNLRDWCHPNESEGLNDEEACSKM